MKTKEELAEEYLLKRFKEYQSDRSVMHIDVEVYTTGFDAGFARAAELLADEEYSRGSQGNLAEWLEEQAK